MKYRVLIARGLSVALVLSAFSMGSQSAVAQDSDADESLEEVVVTGSRIRQNPLDARTPVQILSAEDLEASGDVSLGDFLQRLPISGSAINRSNNASGNLGFPPDGAGIGAGSSEVDLRYLSSKRVLVLVDGQRWVRGSSASGVSGAVDLNTIPANAIGRIEVLQDGASTIYGSDAIAGVVNVITKDNYDGLDVSYYYGLYDEGDGDSQEFNVSFGAESDNARMFIAASYTEQGDVSAADRDISTFPIAGVPIGASSGTPQGRYAFYDPRIPAPNPGDNFVSITLNDGVLNDGGANIPVYDFNDPTGNDFHGFALADRFNYQPFNHLMTPNERVNFFLKGEYDIDDNLMFRMMASFNNRDSQNRAAPEPLFAGPGGGGGAWMESIIFHEDNIYNPFGISLGPDEIQDGFITRRPIEAGPRVFNQNVDTYHVSGGLTGEFETNSSTWYWDVNASWSQNQANQRKAGAFNARKVSLAVGDPAVCAATPGCVAFNWFGGQGPDGTGSITQDMLDYVTFTQKDESEQEMFDVTANISGHLGELAGGPVGVAFGFEYRDEEGFFVPDSVVSSGETAGVPASPTAGSFDVTEFYGEVIAPIVDTFDVSAAVRFSDYDRIGSTEVFKLGLNWRPVDELHLRASFSEGFRAPNIGELFNTGSRFDASITDPCDADALAVDPSLQANCVTLGVPVGYQQLNPQISVTTGGNLSLIPEEAETLTFGLTWDAAGIADRMNSVAGATFEANYYDITVDDAIQAPDAADVLLQCVQTLNPAFCDNVTRVGATVTRIGGVLQNIGGIETTGFDWTVTVDFEPGRWGEFRARWANTHLIDYDEIINGPDGEVTIDRAGTELGSPERGFVEWKSTLIVDWMKEDWTVTLTNRFLSSIDEQCTGLVADFGFSDLCSTPTVNEIGDKLYTDLQVSWSPSGGSSDRRWTIQGGVQNLFDTSTPICFSCDLNSFDGTLHPISGSFFFGRIRLEL
ncbi:MAG: TonB-dependent receptor plug domain-containing protein [Woeseiaceae bacterium]